MFFCVQVIFISLPKPAYADVGPRDFQVILRTLSFIDPPLQGNVVFSVVYDPGISTSVDQAKSVFAYVESKQDLPDGARLQPAMVPVSDLDGLSDSGVVFVSSGMSADFSRIAKSLAHKKQLVISLDRACVEAGTCIVYVSAQDRIEILVNKQALSNVGISFKSAFMVLVKLI